MGEDLKLLEFINQNLNTVARNQALIYHEIRQMERRAIEEKENKKQV
jgi:hypothetical protein